MKQRELMELCGVLARELIDAAALAHLYAHTIRTMQPGVPPRNWSDLTKTERHLYRVAAMIQMEGVLAGQGWAFEFPDIKHES